MILYSYIFNLVYKGYTKSGDEHPGIYAIGIVSLLQFLTVIGAILLPVRLRGDKLGTQNSTIFIVVLVVMLINYIYYFKIHTPTKISQRVESLSVDRIKILKIMTWVHVIITVGLFVFLINLPKSN